MADIQERQLSKRFIELAERALGQGFWTETEFLGLAEQDVLARTRLPLPVSLHAGHPDGERKIAAFGSETLCGCPYEAPIACVEIAPRGPKFAEDLSHRDFLGALMGLGIRRETLGDICIVENRAYVFCLENIAPYIESSLSEVRRTAVRCARAEAPAALVQPPQAASFAVASARLDVLIGAAYRLSRGASRALVEEGRVFVNGRLVQNAAHSPAPGSAVSVRGKGRFVYEGVERETKKGRLRVLLRVFR